MLNLGLIGAGRWGRCYINTLRGMSEIRLAKLASSNPESVSFVRSSCEITDRWEHVADDKSLDGIIVATPPAFHAAIAERAIRSGIPVLIEKPMTLSLAEAIRVASLAESYGVLVMIGHTHLFSSAFRKLKSLGMELGSLRKIRAHGGNWGPWRPDTPMLWDWAAHDIAMCLNLVAKQSLAVTAHLDRREYLPNSIGEAVKLTIEFHDEVIADIRVSNIDQKKSRYFEAEYEKGTLIYDDICSDKLKIRKFSDSELTSVQLDGAMPLNNLLEEFSANIKAGKNHHESLGIGVNVVEVLSLCQQQLDSKEKDLSYSERQKRCVYQ